MKRDRLVISAAFLTLAIGCGQSAPTGGSGTPSDRPEQAVAYVLADGELATFVVAADGGWKQVSAVVEGGVSAALHPGGRFLFVGRTGRRTSTPTCYCRIAAVAAHRIAGGGVAPAVTEVGDYDFAQVLAHPNGRWLYLGDASVPGLSVGAIDPVTGLLGARQLVDGTATTHAVFDPTGRHLYALAGTSGAEREVLGYAVDAVTGRVVSLGTNVEGAQVAMHPNGRAVYVAQNGGDVLAYARDDASGALRLVGRATGAVRPTQLAVDPLGRWLYTATSRVTAHALEPAGAFAGASTGVSEAGRLAVHPDGRFLYVARQDVPEIVAIPTDGTGLGRPRRVAELQAVWFAVAPEAR